MGPRNAVLGVPKQRHAESTGKDGEEGGGGGGGEEERGAPSLQNEDPTPQDGWELSWRRTQPYAVVSTAIVSIFFGGAPYGATNRMRGVPKCGGVHNAKEYDRSDYERMNAGGSERE